MSFSSPGDSPGFGNPIQAKQELNNYLEQKKIVGQIFSGWYTDRIWVEDIRGYRDRIWIDSAEETEITKSLKGVLRRVKKHDLAKKFCGLERNEDQISILLNWEESSSQAFGHFWFFIDKVAFTDVGLEWNVRVLRAVLQSDSVGKCPHCGKYPTDQAKSGDDSSDDPLNITEIANNFQRKFKDLIHPIEWYNDAKPYLTLANFVNVCRFVAILFMALITGLGQLLPKMWQLLNVTIKETGNLLKQMMPFLLACVEMVNKMVGGFYLLITMMWRDSGQKSSSVRPGGLGNKSRNYLEGPSFPYKRENVQRPYLRNQYQ